MKTYKLIKPIGDYPLEEYTKEWDKYVIAKTLEFEWGGSYKVFHYIPAEIVENMPEYFVEVKEDWIDELIDRILPHIENSLETAEDYQWIREAIEKNIPKQEITSDKEYDELMYNDIINGNIYKESKQALKNKPLPPKENKQWTIQIKHCDCWCDNIGKL